jgi:hypothetical protein
MPKKKTVSVEIVRMPSPSDIKALVDQMVRERVDEALAVRDVPQIERGFHTREVSDELRKHQTMFNRRKWSLYFEKWGCQRCGRTKNVSHASNGTCAACAGLLRRRLVHIKREFDRANPESQIAKDIDHLTRRQRTAQELLGEGENGEEEATELSHRWAVSAYRTHNIAAGKCAYCPNPLAPNSTHYCV